MPKEYLYCAQCQTRLSNEDYHRCFEIKGRLVCDGCVTEAMAPLSLKEQEDILLMIREARDNPPPEPRQEPLRINTGRTSQRLAAVRAPLAQRPVAGGSTPRPALPKATPHRTPVGALFTLVVLLIAAGLVVLFLNQPAKDPSLASAPPPKPPAATKKPPTAPPMPPHQPNAAADPAAEALQKARNFVRDFPQDISGQDAAWKKAILSVDGSAYAEGARREYEELRKAHLAAVAEQLGLLDKEVAPLADREEFKKALSALESARSRHGLKAWEEGVDTRARDLNAATWKAFQPLRDRATDAKRRGAQNEVDAVKERVGKWGLDRFVIELDLALASNLPAPPPPPPVEAEPATSEAKAYRTAWEKAVEPTAARNYSAAIRALGNAPEAKEDVDLLKAAAVAMVEARGILCAWPKGQRVALELHTESADFEKSNDPFVRPTETGVELLRGGSPTAVEFEDIAARSLAAIWLTKPGSDRRIAALLCLLEGDAPGARLRLDGQASDVLPAKYWSRAAKMADARSNPAELAARRVWFQAERENASGKTRAAAVAKYRALLNDHAASELVRTRRERIVKRRDAGREYVFLAEDLTGSGTLKLSRSPKPGACWISMADSPAAAGPNNFVEFQFYALPDVTYRAWVYVGGCCQENFEFYCQSTDLTVYDPSSKAQIQAEPGSGAVSPVKHSIPFLKAKHKDHGGPKEAKRWEWIHVLLPKYTAGGVKTVRLVTDQKGFGAAFAVVSASRGGPPVESEMKSWIKVETPVVEEPAAAAVEAPAEKDPALEGHWKFDDTAGATSIDASGGDNTAILAGGATGGPGRLGGALIVDGKDAHAAIPNSPKLDRLSEGSYTISCWFKPASRPQGKSPNENNACYGLVMKTGLHEGLRYGADMKFGMVHWLADGTGSEALSGAACPPGAWYHVAGVVSRPDGTVRLYVNGRPDGTHMWAPNVAPKAYGNATWKIGAGAPGAPEFRWAADGAIDDVRLYSRALNAGEIRALAGGTAAAVMPTVTITSPGPGETYEAGSTLTLAAAVAGLEKVARVDFLLGSTVLGSDTSAPFAATWPKVPSGIYPVVARATLPEKGAPPIFSKPLTVRVGDVTLHRAINFGSPQRAVVDGLTFEPGSGAPNLAINGERVERRDVELLPPVEDGQTGLLLRSALSYRDGVVATLTKVPNGTYQVYAYVWEDNENATFDVLLEDKVVQSKVQSGPAGSWAKLGPWTVDVVDSSLKLAVRGGPANFSGIEVWKVTR